MEWLVIDRLHLMWL